MEEEATAFRLGPITFTEAPVTRAELGGDAQGALGGGLESPKLDCIIKRTQLLSMANYFNVEKKRLNAARAISVT